MLGFTALLVAQRSERRWYWMAYGGAGLALATKGGLGLLVVAYFLVAALAARGLRGVRSLLHMPSMMTSLAVGLAWYLAALLVHGSDMWLPFWTDQVGSHIMAEDWSGRLQSLSHYSGYYLLCFLVWLPFLPGLLLGNRGMFQGRSGQHRFADGVALGWIVVTAVIFSFSKGVSDRYTLAAVPLGAVLLAGLFRRADSERRQSQLSRGIKLYVALLILTTAAVAWVNVNLVRNVLAIAVSAGGLLVGAVLLVGSQNERWLARPVAIGLAVLALVPTLCLGLGHLALPDQGEQIARTLQGHQLLRGQNNHQPILMIGKGGLAAKIRVFTSGDAVLERYRRANAPGAPEAIASAEWILTSKEIFATLGLTEWSCTTASSGPFADTSLGDVYRAVRQGYPCIGPTWELDRSADADRRHRYRSRKWPCFPPVRP